MKTYTFIFFTCPECGNTLKIPHSLKDSRGCCPFCENIIQVPEFVTQDTKDSLNL